jgi:hypothetical protein
MSEPFLDQQSKRAGRSGKGIGLLVGLVVVALLTAGVGYGYFGTASPGGRTPAVSTAKEQPRIQVVPGSYDFGDISSTAVEYTFSVRNVGDAPLEIMDLSTSCGCTTVSISAERIVPGQAADLRVTFDPNYHGTEGRVFRLVFIKSNDPVQPEVQLEIRANVVK